MAREGSDAYNKSRIKKVTIDDSGTMNGNNNCSEKDADGATSAIDNNNAAVKPDNHFIAGLKRLAEERRIANEANKEKVASAAAAAEDETGQLDNNNSRDQIGKEGSSNTIPAKVEGVAVANGNTKGDIPDMTGKVISVSTTENNQPHIISSSNNQPQQQSKRQQQHRHRDNNESESKQQQQQRRQKKKSGAGPSGSHPKKKPTTSISQVEDGLLPDMTGKEILVEQLELPEIEPVREEVDLDDLILEEQSTSTNKRRTAAGAAAGTSKNHNRRGLLSKSNQTVSQRSILTSSTTSDSSVGGGGGGGGVGRSQLFASYNCPSQRSLQTQTTTSGTPGKDIGGDDSELLPQKQQQQNSEQLPQNISTRASNSCRDRASSLHSSFQHYQKPALGRIPSGGILPDVDEEQTQSKLSSGNNNTISKSMPPRTLSRSWASLIALDEQSKRASIENMEGVKGEEPYTTPNSHRRKTSGLSTSWTSIKSEESVKSRGSRESGSRRSNRSKSDVRSRRSNRSGNQSRSGRRQASSENWKNESTMSVLPSLSQMKDPEYIRSQAIERFERGLEYAEYGKLDAARERFLVALRYRVMDRGSLHPDVAATHEMLGHVEYFLAENKKNDNFEGSLVRLDEGDDGLLGGNLTIMENPDKDGQPSSGGKSHYEKAAMHYQNALDILDAKELDISNEKVSAWMNGGSSKDETTFQWKELAGTYSALDEKGRLGIEERIDIVGRIQERMDELPVSVGEKSYATSFLSSF